MKRTIFIIAGISIVLVLIGLWAYILFTGTTSETVSFNDFGFGDTTDPTVIIPEEDPLPEEPIVTNDPNERLRQLTTKPVVGFTEVTTSSSSSNPTALYTEAGTGHIFSIDLETGEEERISATTIPLARAGVITPNGQHVLIQSDDGAQASFIIGTLSSTSDRMNNFALEEDVVAFTATNDNELLYATPTGNTLTVKAYTPATNITRTLFTIPFRDAAINWHHTTAGPHIVYPKATSGLEGYVYTYTDGVVSRVAANGYGLSAVGSAASVVYSAQVDGTYLSFHVNNGELDSIATSVTFVPEKCRFTTLNSTIAICGSTLDEYSSQMPDEWYQGIRVFNDVLWEYDTARQAARLLVSPERDTGRQVDLVNPMFGQNDNNLFFQNKIDQTLWVYEYRTNSN